MQKIIKKYLKPRGYLNYMAGYITVPSFFSSPVAHFKVKNLRKVQENSVPQENFFRDLHQHIYNSAGSNDFPPHHDSILFFGYDTEFMNDDRTIQTLAESIEQRKRYTARPGYPIKLIVPESCDISKLEDLMKEEYFFKVAKTHSDIKKGFIVYGGIGVSFWNSEMKTTYPPEAETAIYRESIVNRTQLVDIAAKRFEEFYFKAKK